MGWTEHTAICEKKQGKINIKNELDTLYSYHSYTNLSNYVWCDVLKSAIRGNEYYAAVRYRKWVNNKLEIDKVVALAGKFSLKKREGFDYAENIHQETTGPLERHCPIGILKLLSDTDDTYALGWREECYNNLAEERNKDTLGTLPLGSIIEVEIREKEKEPYCLRFVKTEPKFQFKRPFWFNETLNKYIKVNQIPKDYKIIRKGYF